MINIGVPETDGQLSPRITVVGVGGAGGNAVNNMIRSNLEGVEFLVCNTDAQALRGSNAERKLRLGVGITQGLGAGASPDVGKHAAEDAIDDLVQALEGSHMVFITAGMGGGTGTGASPVIARVAREMDMLTVGVVTKPFHFEGAHRMRVAEAGLKELQQYVDTLIVIPNQNLFRIANEKTTFADAFKMADDVLHSGVRGVTDLMVMPGLINLDFADIRSVMGEMGKAMMGTGEADGERRAISAAEAAISNPLLDDVSMKGARGVLINITGGLDMTLYEVDEAANRIRDEVDPDANIIFGSTFDEAMEGKVRVSVVATGIDAEEAMMTRPHAVTNTAAQAGGARVVPMPAAPAPQPAAMTAQEPAVAEFQPELTAAVVAPAPAMAAAEPGARMEPAQPVAQPQPAVATAAVRAQAAPAPRADRGDATFIPPEPVQPTQRPGTHPGRAGIFGIPNLGGASQRDDRSLLQRMTQGTARRRDDEGEVAGHQHAPAAQPAAQPVAQAPAPQAAAPAAAQPAVSARPAESVARPALPPHDDEALNIPAFLRRQAN